MVLPSREATSLALATSELVQNAVKHAFAGRDRGRIGVQLRLGATESEVVVEDDGVGAERPPSPPRGIGLQLVETLVREDLKGRFESTASPAGTRAVIRFPGAAGAGAQP
jgi:two-component sensor histidine kinase